MRLTRRVRLCLLASVTLAGVLGSLAVGAVAPAQAATVFQEFHDVNGSVYQQKFTDLANAGYRPKSLTMYGSASDPRYAAVFVKAAGPAFTGIHGATLGEYNSFATTQADNGFHVRLLAAVG